MWPLLVLMACSDGVDSDNGADASMLVGKAQFFRAAMPDDASGPGVKAASVAAVITVGQSDRSCTGSLDSAATSVAFQLAGDIGYWVLPASIPDVNAPANPTFVASLSFSRKVAAGDRQLLVRAVDSNGHFGPPLVKSVKITSNTPDGHLVVSLSWQNKADLDLHVVDPNGVEVFARNQNSYVPPPPGMPAPPGLPHDGGVLDFDSNAQCVQDGRMAEDVVWSDPPPNGHYVVRVDTADLCGETESPWRVEVKSEGVTIATASGIGTVNDTRFPHELGGGVLALEFDVP